MKYIWGGIIWGYFIFQSVLAGNCFIIRNRTPFLLKASFILVKNKHVSATHEYSLFPNRYVQIAGTTFFNTIDPDSKELETYNLILNVMHPDHLLFIKNFCWIDVHAIPLVEYIITIKDWAFNLIKKQEAANCSPLQVCKEWFSIHSYNHSTSTPLSDYLPKQEENAPSFPDDQCK